MLLFCLYCLHHIDLISHDRINAYSNCRDLQSVLLFPFVLLSVPLHLSPVCLCLCLCYCRAWLPCSNTWVTGWAQLPLHLSIAALNHAISTRLPTQYLSTNGYSSDRLPSYVVASKCQSTSLSVCNLPSWLCLSVWAQVHQSCIFH